MDIAPISRIVVETEPDWLRIKDNVHKGMISSMEARLSSLPGGRDGPTARGVRKEIEARLTGIREEMFKMSNPNLRVNGHNYEEFVDATEPFDEALDRNILSLYIERVGWDMDVAGRRKTVPGHIYKLEQNLEARREAAEWLEEGEDEESVAAKKPKMRADTIPRPPRHQETIETFNTVVSNLSELASSAPAQLARAQRAQTVRDEIASLPA